MNQLTLRQIPEPVDRALRALARDTGMSLNKTAISVLKKGLGLEPSQAPKRDLSALFARWTVEQANELDRNLEILEQIDERMWQ